MQYPAFVVPWLGNGMLIALYAVLHVISSHGFAIGAIAMIVLAEAIGIRRGNEDWDRFARSFLKFLIIIVTGILGFMLTPDGWLDGEGLVAAFLNASFLPQLLMRLGIAFTLGSIIAAAYAVFR